MPDDPLDRLFERFARRGDTHALGEVYDALAPKLYRLALHLARDGAEAEDLLQATFVTAIERAAMFTPGQALEPWLSGILANHARNAGRRAARTSTGEVSPVDSAPEPADEASRAELDESLARALEKLPEAYRPALVLRLRHGLSVAEIAEALGTPPGTVRSQLARGTELLRRSLPAGLVGAFAALLAPHAAGLAGVRTAVLAHAEVASASLALGGLWIVKKWIAAAVVVLLFSGAVGYGILNTRDVEAPRLPLPAEPALAEPASTTPVDSSAAVHLRTEESQTVAARPAAPVASTGSVEVEVRYASNHEPASGVTVVLRVDHRDVSYDDERSAELDLNGRARWTGLPPTFVLAHALPGGVASGLLKAGTTLSLTLLIPDGVEVSGEVVDAAAQPVPDAQIWLSELNMPALGRVCARCDGKGRFHLRSVGAKRWIGAKSASAALSYLQCVRGTAGEKQEVRIVLDREGTRLSGSVLDDQRRPVAHAQVLAGSEEVALDRLLGDGSYVPGGAPQRAESDDEGRFEFGGLPLGACTLRARAPGLTGSARTLQLLPGSNRFDVVLDREAVVAGRVSDASGAPIGQARVFSGQFGRFETRVTTSLADGSFALNGLEPGECQLVADLQDGWRVEERVSLSAGERREWNPRLSPADAIRGIVRSSAGQPLAGWSVLLSDEAGSKDGWQSANTDADGRFRLRAQPENLYRLAVFEPQRWSEFPRATLRGLRVDGTELAIEIREDSTDDASLSGRVLDGSGKPVPDAWLLLWHVEQGVGRTLSTDEHGDVRLAHVPVGHLQLEVRSLEHPWRKLGEREARAGERIDLGTIELANGGRIAGTLRGAGEAKFEITVADEHGLLAGTIEIHGSEYRSNALAPGSYRLYVRGSGVGDQQHDFDITAGRELRLDLVLEPMSVRKLVLQTGERTRASKAVTCIVTDGAGRQVCMRSVPVASAASLELELSMPAGVHKLVVLGETGQLLESQISASGAGTDPELTLTLP
jgi:RNA polymerase sigma-70 factor (ECF subfamily)